MKNGAEVRMLNNVISFTLTSSESHNTELVVREITVVAWGNLRNKTRNTCHGNYGKR